MGGNRLGCLRRKSDGLQSGLSSGSVMSVNISDLDLDDVASPAVKVFMESKLM